MPLHLRCTAPSLLSPYLHCLEVSKTTGAEWRRENTRGKEGRPTEFRPETPLAHLKLTSTATNNSALATRRPTGLMSDCDLCDQNLKQLLATAVKFWFLSTPPSEARGVEVSKIRIRQKRHTRKGVKHPVGRRLYVS